MKLTLRTVLLGIVVIAMSSVIATAQAPKKYLFEYFTGAWCQFCPNGALTMQQIESDNPDIIHLAIHGGNGTDNMKTADGNAMILVASLAGYPSSMLDRFGFSATDQNGNAVKATTFGANNWTPMLNVRRQQSPSSPVSVFASGSYNPTTRELTVRVTGEFVAGLSGDVRLNAMLVEDSVSGAGLGWDQVNAFNLTVGHPFYQKGNPIVGYQHRNVFRANMGGLWGKPNSLPTTITAGSVHTTDLVFTVPATWNVNRLYVLPIVQRFNALFTDREIFNADIIPVSTLKPRTTVVNYSGSPFSVRPVNEMGMRTASVQNVTIDNTEYTVTVTKSASTPVDWTASITESGNAITSPLVIASNTTKIFTFGLTTGATAGYGEATFTVRHPNGQEFIEKVAVLSSNVTAINLSSNNNQTFDNDLLAAGKTHFANVPGKYVSSNPGDFAGLSSLKTVLWHFGEKDVMSASDVNIMDAYYEKGVNIMLGGAFYLFQLAGINTNPPTMANTFLAKMGTGFIGVSTVNQGPNSIHTFNGVSGDPITSGMSYPVSVVQYKTASLSAAGANASAMLRYQGPNEVVAVRNEVNGRGRTIMLGFNPENITNPQMKAQFIDASVTWLEGAVAGPAPKIAASVPSIDFGAVGLNTSMDKSLTITNTGEGDLILSGNLFITGDSPNFEIKTGDILNNITLAKNQTHTFVLKFTPDEAKQYSTKFQVFSNDPTASSLDIPITGAGGNGASVAANVNAVEFKGVQVQTTSIQTIILTNTGSADLMISAINLTGTDISAYTITEGKPDENPITVAANATTTFKVQFAPTQVRPYTANVVVVSNAAVNLTLAVSGEGTPPTSVRATSPDGMFDMKLTGKNPIENTSSVEFTIGAKYIGEVPLTIIDASGATVLQLGAVQLNMGTTTLPFSVGTLASGAYTLVAYVNGNYYTIPVRIAR